MQEAKSYTQKCRMYSLSDSAWLIFGVPSNLDHSMVPQFCDFPEALSSRIQSEGAQLNRKMSQRHFERARRGCIPTELGSNTKQSSPNICPSPSADRASSDTCSWWGDGVPTPTQRFGAALSGRSLCCRPSGQCQSSEIHLSVDSASPDSDCSTSDLSTLPLQWASAPSCWENTNGERTIHFPRPLGLSGVGQVATTRGSSSVKLNPSFRHCTANIFPWPSFCHGWKLIWKQQSVCSSKKWSPWVSAENYHWWQRH